MEQVDHFYGYFSLAIGVFFMVVGFWIYKPKRDDEGEKRFQKMKNFYILAGIAFSWWANQDFVTIFTFL